MSAKLFPKSFKILKETDDLELTKEDPVDDFKTATRINNKSKSYIPLSRFTEKYLKLSCIVLLVIVVLIVITTISLYCFSSSTQETEVLNSKSNNTYESHLSPLEQSSPADLSQFLNSLILVENNHTFWSVDPNSSKFKVFHRIRFDYTAYDFYLNKTMFWIEENALTVGSFWVEENKLTIGSLSKDFHNITYTRQWNMQAIATDFITEKLYAVDESAGTLSVIDLRRNLTGVILSTLKNPHDIVLDPTQGYIFIVQHSDSILRLDMDGTQPNVIATSGSVIAITINLMTKTIFWANALGNIESSDYYGRNRKVVINVSEGISSLTILDNKLFWLTSSNETYNSTIFSCEFEKDNCKNTNTKIHVPFRSIDIKALANPPSITYQNPCKTRNGECHHLCLLNSKNYTCGCKINFELMHDSKTCLRIEDSLLYAQGNLFKGVILNDKKGAFTDSFYPTRLIVGSLRYKNRIDFDKGWDPAELFASDGECIYKLNVYDGTQTTLYMETDGDIKDVAIDWFSKNLYYCVFKTTDTYSINIISIKGDRVFHKTSKLQKLNEIVSGYAFRSLVVYPHEKLYFYNLYASENLVMQSQLNGDNTVEFWRNYFLDKSELGILTIDYKENILYRIEDEYWEHMTIKVLSYPLLLQGSTPHNDNNVHRYSLTTLIDVPTSVSVYKDWLYISTPSDIWRVDKTTGENATKIISASENGNSKEQIHRLRIFSAEVMYQSMTTLDNECIVNNGGCDQFCFLVGSTKTCSCEDGKTYKNGLCS